MVASAKLPKRNVLRVVGQGDNQPKGQNQDEFLYHVGVIGMAKAKVEAVKKGLKAARRAAMDAGYNLADMDEAIFMRDQDPETVEATIMRKAQYAHWIGAAPALTQGDLFSSNDESDADKWFKEGRDDGITGQPNKGDRYEMTSEAGQARMKGWNEGNERRLQIQDQQLAQFKENAQKAKDEKKAKDAAKAEREAKKAAKAKGEESED